MKYWLVVLWFVCDISQIWAITQNPFLCVKNTAAKLFPNHREFMMKVQNWLNFEEIVD